jgi:hypothetical protein
VTDEQHDGADPGESPEPHRNGAGDQAHAEGQAEAHAEARARALSHFAEILIHQVRDQPIRICDHLVAGRIRGPEGERWRSIVTTPEARSAVTELLPDIVYQVLAHLLNALDQGDLPLAWRGEDGTCVDLYDLGRGEMAGWLFGEDSWRERFSGERFTQ